MKQVLSQHDREGNSHPSTIYALDLLERNLWRIGCPMASSSHSHYCAHCYLCLPNIFILVFCLPSGEEKKNNTPVIKELYLQNT